MFINLTTEYYVWKQLLAKSMSHSNLPRDIFFVKRMLSSFWLIWKVIAIRFSHRKQCLIATSSNIVPSAPLHLNQIFCFYLYLNIKKVILLLNTNNLCQLQTFFINQSHSAISLLTCLPWCPSHSPDIYYTNATSVSNSLHFLER